MDVYFTNEISTHSLKKIFSMFKEVIDKNDVCAIKLTFGEKDNLGYIKPNFVRAIVEEVKNITPKVFITDTNTIYRGWRDNTISHLELAKEHGFNIENCLCPIVIADGLFGKGGVEVEVNLKHYKKVEIANAIYYSDVIISIAHFKGHPMCGFGGAIKNVGMGSATKKGKYLIHHQLEPNCNPNKCNECEKCIKFCPVGAISINKKISIDTLKCIGCGECVAICPNEVFRFKWDEKIENSLEKLVEYAYGAVKGRKSIFINFLNFITKGCDCFATREKPLLPDIGILGSNDIVAIDQASVDVVNRQFKGDFFKHIYPTINYNHQLIYAEEIGLGKRNYKIIEI